MAKTLGTDWRCTISNEERTTVIKYMYNKIRSFVPDVPLEVVYKRICIFEQTSFRQAVNQKCYISNVAFHLCSIELLTSCENSHTMKSGKENITFCSCTTVESHTPYYDECVQQYQNCQSLDNICVQYLFLNELFTQDEGDIDINRSELNEFMEVILLQHDTKDDKVDGTSR